MLKWFCFGVCLTFFALLGGVNAQDKEKLSKDLLQGEWTSLGTREKKDDIMLVMTFRPNGVCRLDAVDTVTRKQPRGPKDRLPGVGIWKIDGNDVVITWENWNEGKERPIQVPHRIRVEKLTEKEFVYRTILPDRPKEKQEATKWKRFEGWSD